MANQPLSNEQLASLLLDGELSGDDLAQANQRLADDAEFAAEVTSLREQRELFAGLPVYKTPDDFSDRTLEASISQVQAIMGEFATRRSALDNDGPMVANQSNAQGQGLSSAYAWRTAVGAVACLAGMILLTLFVFPESTLNTSEVASVTVDKADAGAMEMDGVAEAIVEKTAEGGMPEFAMKKADPQSNSDFAAGGGMGGFGGVRSKQSMNEEQSFNSLASKDADEGISISQQMANAAVSPKTSVPPFKSSFSGMPMAKTVSQVAAPAVEQIWYVDLDNPNRALASVGEILGTNQIQVQSANARELPKNQSAGGLGSRNAKSGFEAFYVSATQSQMKQALIELSDKAEISTLPIAINNGPPVMEMSNAMTDVADASQGLQKADELQVQRQQIAGVPPSLERSSNQAMAQQLVQMPLNRGMNRGMTQPVPPIPSSDDPALNKLVMADADVDSNDDSPSLAGSRMKKSKQAESMEPNQKTARDSVAIVQSGAGNASDQEVEDVADDKAYFDEYFQLTESEDTQLRQYLILVRTPDEPESSDDDVNETK